MKQLNQVPVAYLILTNGNPEEWHAAIESRRKVIGRSKECDIRIPVRFPHLSRRHAEICGDHREIVICDLGSRSGTRVNGVWIEKHQEVYLLPGDRIWLGGVELDVVSEIPTIRAAQEDSDPSDVDSDRIFGPTAPLPAQVLLAELTQAELAVVMWIGRGLFKDEEIAEKLFRSPHTVRTQINSIFRKLNVRSRADIFQLLKNSS